VLFQPVCLIPLTHLPLENGVVSQNRREEWVVWTDGLFDDRGGDLVQRFSLLVFLELRVQVGQIVEAGGHLGVMWSEGFFINLDGPGVERFSLKRIPSSLCGA